jgi:protein-disulfide isomerase
MKALAPALLFALLVSASACAQPSAQNNDPDRAERILANIRFEFPQLEGTRLEMETIEASDIDGLDRGAFVINGQQRQEFLVSRDDTRLYLIVADAIDVSRSADGLAEAQRERETAAVGAAQERARELNETFAGLPVRGNPNAPVTVIEFSDYQCPYCARAYTTIEQLLENNPDSVRLIYVQYPLPNHAWARPAAIASLCAAQQDGAGFWALHDGYFENQRTMTPANVMERSRGFLAGTDVDTAAWQTCVEDTSSPAHREAVAALDLGMNRAQELGVSGTPAFFINGQFLNGAQPLEVFQGVVDAARSAGS